MLYYLIVCTSLTQAQRSIQYLERAGIHGWLLRSPMAISGTGCGYSVKIAQKNLNAALTILRRYQVPYVGVYVGSPQEGYQEVLL